MMKKITCFLTLLILFSTGVLALSYPHAFYGSVTYSNGSQLNDLTIKAILGSFQDTSQITNSRYGENQDTLIVESESDGGLIQFYISNKPESIGNYTFKRFEITELNFIIPAPQNQNNTLPENPPSNPPPSSSSSSSSGGGGGGSTSNKDRTHQLIENINSTIVLNPSTNQTQPTNQQETTNLNQNKNPSITGAVIGTNTTQFAIITLIILVIATAALITFSLKRSRLRKKQ